MTLKESLRLALQDNAALEAERENRTKASDEQFKHQQREAESLRRLIVDLVQDERTLKLRFSWLEEAATDVVNACDEHKDGLIVRLADELGIDLAKELT